jgi:hypothetical protein
MWEFTAATAIGIVFGLLYHYYFKRRADDVRGDVK